MNSLQSFKRLGVRERVYKEIEVRQCHNNSEEFMFRRHLTQQSVGRKDQDCDDHLCNNNECVICKRYSITEPCVLQIAVLGLANNQTQDYGNGPIKIRKRPYQTRKRYPLSYSTLKLAAAMLQLQLALSVLIATHHILQHSLTCCRAGASKADTRFNQGTAIVNLTC